MHSKKYLSYAILSLLMTSVSAYATFTTPKDASAPNVNFPVITDFWIIHEAPTGTVTYEDTTHVFSTGLAAPLAKVRLSFSSNGEFVTDVCMTPSAWTVKDSSNALKSFKITHGSDSIGNDESSPQCIDKTTFDGDPSWTVSGTGADFEAGKYTLEGSLTAYYR